MNNNHKDMNYSEEQILKYIKGNTPYLEEHDEGGFLGIDERELAKYIFEFLSNLPKEIEPTEQKTAEELLNKHYPLQTVKPISKLQRLCIIDAINEALQSQPVKKPLSDEAIEKTAGVIWATIQGHSQSITLEIIEEQLRGLSLSPSEEAKPLGDITA